jgi:hypothetical protein
MFVKDISEMTNEEALEQYAFFADTTMSLSMTLQEQRDKLKKHILTAMNAMYNTVKAA